MPDVGTKTRPLADLSLALTSRDQRDRNWLHSVSRFLAGQSVVRSLLRTHDPDPRPPVTFSRQRQSVAISPYAGYVLRDNEFYAFAMSDDGQPCATSCPRVSGLQICDHCKSAISWYFGTLSRQVTELILHCQPVGSFLVRNSSSRCGTFALSVRVQQDAERPTGVAHYLLIKSAKSRVQIKVKDLLPEPIST